MPPNGTVRILVVDDEESLRRVIARALVEEGYEVVAARDGAEAWHLLQDGSRPVDAVVTDVVMPRMNGLELARHVATLADPPPVLFISGYGHDVAALREPFLPKPFRPDQLARMVARLVG